MLSATRTLIEDIRAFNIEYKESFEKKKEEDETLFKGIEIYISTFQEQISKVAANSRSSISDANVNKVVSLIEACFKSQLALILDLVPPIPKNSPRVMQVSQGREKGGSS